jgi:single-stranded DNA-binding protein
MARTILGILPNRYRKDFSFIPVCAFSTTAHIMTHLCHKGSLVMMQGALFSDSTLTSEQSKTLIKLTFYAKDIVVLKREDLKLDDIDFVGTAQMYDPELFLEMEPEGYDPQ